MVTPHCAAKLRSHWGEDREGDGGGQGGVGREGAWILWIPVLLRLSVEGDQFLVPLAPPVICSRWICDPAVCDQHAGHATCV